MISKLFWERYVASMIQFMRFAGMEKTYNVTLTLVSMCIYANKCDIFVGIDLFPTFHHSDVLIQGKCGDHTTPFFEILQNAPLTNSCNLGHDALLKSLMGHRCLLLDVPRMEHCSSWDIKYIHSLLTRNKMKVCKNLSLNLFTSLLQGSNHVSLLSVTF